jgi:hypothetical protein
MPDDLPLQAQAEFSELYRRWRAELPADET